MNILKSGGTLFLAHEVDMGRAVGQPFTNPRKVKIEVETIFLSQEFNFSWKPKWML